MRRRAGIRRRPLHTLRGGTGRVAVKLQQSVILLITNFGDNTEIIEVAPEEVATHLALDIDDFIKYKQVAIRVDGSWVNLL